MVNMMYTALVQKPFLDKQPAKLREYYYLRRPEDDARAQTTTP